MRYRWAVGIAICAALLLGANLPASAGDRAWILGTGFQVGDHYFKIGYWGGDHGPSHYHFRVSNKFHYPHRSCSDRCFRAKSYSYHVPTCPALRHHMARYGRHPRVMLRLHAPAYRNGYAHNRRGYYDGYGRYGYDDYGYDSYSNDGYYYDRRRRHGDDDDDGCYESRHRKRRYYDGYWGKQKKKKYKKRYYGDDDDDD